MLNKLDVSPPQRVRLSTAESEERVQLLLEFTDDLASVYIMDHPFTRRLEKGDLPLEAIQTACLDWYVWHRKLAASFSRSYHRFLQICRMYRDIEEEFLERIAHELTRPTAGGRTILLHELALALGVPERTVNNPPQGSNLRGYIAFYSRLHSEGTFAEVASAQLGSAFAPYARLWCQALERLAVSKSATRYWEMNARLDRDEAGGGVLGTRQENAVGFQIVMVRGGIFFS